MRDASSPGVDTFGVLVVPSTLDRSARVAGLDPLLRHCLTLQSAGVQCVYIVGAETPLPDDPRLKLELRRGAPEGPATRFLVVRADWTFHRALPARLASFDIDPDQTLTIEGELVAGSAIVLAGGLAFANVLSALQEGREPIAERTSALNGEFMVPARDAAECRASVPLHMRSLIKARVGMVDRHVLRRISSRLTPLLFSSSITPNLVTWLSLAIAFVAAVLVGVDEPAFYIAGAVLHLVVRVLDCVDGELARIRFQGTAFGQFLDTIADGIGIAALMLGVTYRARAFDPAWVYVGLGGVLVYLGVQVLQLQLARLTTGGSSLQEVEWEFLREDATGVDRFVGLIHNFIRVDFISTIYALLIVFNQLHLLLVVHALASTGGALYLGVSLVTKRRKRHT